MTTMQSGWLLAIALVLPASGVLGAIETRDTLKTYFETGDVPTQQQFSITSPTGDPSPLDPPDFLLQRGSGGHHLFEGLFGAQVVSDGAGHGLPLGAGTVVGPSSTQFAS